MDDLLTEFLTETSENLAVIDCQLVSFEKNPHDTAILGNVFRLVHTIKGTCGFLGLSRLEAVAHAGENVLGRFRDGQISVSSETVSLVLHCIDSIRAILNALERDGREPAGDDKPLIAELNRAAEGGSEGAGDAIAEFEPPPITQKAPAKPGNGGDFPVAAELLLEVEAAEAAGFRAASDEQISAELDTERQREQGRRNDDGASTPGIPINGSDGNGEVKEPSVVSQSIRVSVDTLETLMTLVSELVLTRNQLLQMVRGCGDNEFTAPLQRLSHITSELQEGVMKTRMQPIGNAWAKLPRIIRDLALETGKQLELRMQGAETELDRQVLELIKDPLTHMVRNSADHGIEAPNERVRVGKSELGIIKLNAYHEGGHIIVQVEDDGRGLDVEKIRKKAVASGLVSEAESLAMSEQQLFQFIFKPGFSTSEKISNVSGRGVGMDVVRTNIEKIGGTVEVKSRPGIGSTFVIKIPLTLAIVSALIIGCGGHRFAFPQICVLELVRVSADNDTRFELINGTPILRLRNKLLPLVDLHDLLDLSADKTAYSEERFVIVTQVGLTTFGIIVDEIFDTEEIVVKPVCPIISNIPHYAGNTILGDGRVIMILDPNGIAGVIGHHSGEAESQSIAGGAESQSKAKLLIFRAGNDLKVVPLDLVSRLENIALADVEWSQERPMLQYRGHLMPLVACDPSFDWRKEGSSETLVFTEQEKSMGLVVDEIVDIVEERLLVEISATGSDGILGSAVINSHLTNVIDTGYYLTQAYPGWFSSSKRIRTVGGGINRHVLLIEDSSFFCSLIVPTLEASGFSVTSVPDALQALRLCGNGMSFDAIISDIELPGMSGFEFAEKVRGNQKWSGVPLLALSGYTSPKDLARAREVGFTDYIAKYDREGLIASLNCHVLDDVNCQ